MPLELSAADWAGLATIGVIYALTLAYTFRLRFATVGPRDAVVQIVGDVLIAAGLVFLTGGAESPFTFTFSVAVIGAALMLGFRSALASAVASLILYTAVVLGIQAGLLVPPIGGASLTPLRLAFHLSTNGLAIVLVGTLAGYLSRQLATTGGRLVEREKDLRSLSELHRQILEAMPSGLVTADGEGGVIFANPTAQAILGQDIEQLVGSSLSSVFPGIDMLGVHASRRELTIRTPVGKRILGLSVTPMAVGSRRDPVLLVFQDLTELRRLEQELHRADRLAALGQMAAQLAHEIRNPLAAMRGSAQLLTEETAGNEVAERLGRILIRESDRLARLVDEVLRFARPANPRHQHLDLSVLVEEVLHMLHSDPLAEGILLAAEGEGVEADVDPDQLRQVLLNLVRNALQAAGRGGQVRVLVGQEAGSAVLEVRDSGPPIPEAILSRFFEPFFTTRQGGTGLGLATAHAIVSAHRGSLSVASTAEAGTIFTIRIPLEPVDASGTPIPPPSVPRVSGRLT